MGDAGDGAPRTLGRAELSCAPDPGIREARVFHAVMIGFSPFRDLIVVTIGAVDTVDKFC